MFTPAFRARLARWSMVVALFAWPITQFTIARDEPPFTLGLSWLAIILTFADLSATTDVREHSASDEHAA